MGQNLILNMSSAFRLFVSEREWTAAYEIVERFSEDAFATPGVRGWRAVTLAHIHPEEAQTRFDEAANAFSADVAPDQEELMRRGSWSGINSQLWAKYFRSRARLVEAIRNPDRMKELLADAVDALAGTESGWHSPEASRFHVLVKALATLVSHPRTFDPAKARREYMFEMRISEETSDDRTALQFISDAGDAFHAFETDPFGEMTRNRLAGALDALAKIATIGPDVTKVLGPAIGKSALYVAQGPSRGYTGRSKV